METAPSFENAPPRHGTCPVDPAMDPTPAERQKMTSAYARKSQPETAAPALWPGCDVCHGAIGKTQSTQAFTDMDIAGVDP